METVLLDIISELRAQGQLSSKQLEQMLRRHNKARGSSDRNYTKKELLPYYLRVKETNPAYWKTWDVDEELEHKLLRLLQMKPRRTASGVATITVITKPWPCSSNCMYCPNDVRMPKSYLSGEPACQRAERNYFDPYLQVISRLRALTDMGHVTDKIELIILGGTWSDYPEAYQLWFMKELFRALNEGIEQAKHAGQRFLLYQDQGLSNQDSELKQMVAREQQAVYEGTLNYNQAIQQLYSNNPAWLQISAEQEASLDELRTQQKQNERAPHRMVGLVVETRPDTISVESLRLLRQMGCTKIQMGIQSLDATVLKANNRRIELETIRNAFALVRLFGFKIQGHFMLNLFGSDPEADKKDYLRFVTEEPYQPDEIKLYPCSLVEGTELCARYADGSWQPYTEQELMDVLIACTLATPRYVRISRMIRDISAEDILVGNKKANLRQMVEQAIETGTETISEIRHREIRTSEITSEELSLKDLIYQTSVSTEHFLEWVTPENRIAGFLRLSLPQQTHLEHEHPAVPIGAGEAMIREVHIYGKVARLHKEGEDAQHTGLGKQLIDEACRIAQAEGYNKMNVISAVGTREYYRKLGFVDKELYQQKKLDL